MRIYDRATDHQQLKQEYDIVKGLRKLSGFGWNEAKMTVTASNDVWTDYCAVSTAAI